jgi:hypothetical protein
MEHYSSYILWGLGALGGLFAFAIGWVKWSAHQAFASKSELSTVKSDLAALKGKVDTLPSAQDLNAVVISITQLMGKIDTQTAILTRVETVVTRHEEMIAEAASTTARGR